MEWTHDAIVIGGGPAGSLSALLLARLGWRVMLVERGAKSRDKTCGHCLSNLARSALGHADLLDRTRLLSVGRMNRLHVHLARGRQFDLPLTRHGKDGGVLVRRDAFDQMLRDAAVERGVELIQPASANLLKLDADGATAMITPCNIGGPRSPVMATTGLVVGADGLRSRVARDAGLADRAIPGRKFGCSITIQTPAARFVEPDHVHMFVDVGGYLGVINEGDDRIHLAAMIGPNAGESREPIAFMKRLAGRFELLSELGIDRLTTINGTISNGPAEILAAGPMPWQVRAVSRRHVALVGDAAGYVEPFTGEGMSWAMRSAVLLADVSASIRPGDWSDRAAARFADAWSGDIRRLHWRCSLISWLLEHPAIIAALARIGGRRSLLARHAVSLVMSS